MEELRVGKGWCGWYMVVRVGECLCCFLIDLFVMIVVIDVLIRSGYYDLYELRIK